MHRNPFLILLFLACALPSLRAAADDYRSIAAATRNLAVERGFITLYHDGMRGRLLLELDDPGREFLYLPSLATGVGASELAFADRGTIGRPYLARFERDGGRVLLVLRAAAYRPLLGQPAVQRAADESFASSTVGAFDIIAQSGNRLLVDATNWLRNDALGLAERLNRAGEGSYRIDPALSRIHAERTRAYPRNTEIEAALTFVATTPGPVLDSHVPDGRAVTLRQHHSFVTLPDDGYRPRPVDPRIGTFMVRAYDFARGDGADPARHFAARHRLVPGEGDGRPRQPIVYYLDRAIPAAEREIIREAGRAWSRALEEAGFRDALRIEDMPADMDPMDARFHVILWVHRTARGSNTGPTLLDPRSGEIIKAAIRLESQYPFVSRDLFAGLAPALANAARTDDAARRYAHARLRKLALHEIGHTLGLSHNLAGGSHAAPSVMDLLAPSLRIGDGHLDIDEAWPAAPGPYDVAAIRYLYTPLSPADEATGLDAIVATALADGLNFVSDSEWGPGGSYPAATPWTRGADTLAAFRDTLATRQLLIERFDERALLPGESLSALKPRFVRLYFQHRAALEALVKNIGGMRYAHALPWDGQQATDIVPGERQRDALALVLEALEPQKLAVPERILRLFAPGPAAYGFQRHRFERELDEALDVDQLEIARSLAALAMNWLLLPERTARVVAFHARDASLPSLDEVIETLVAHTWGHRDAPPLRRVVQRALLDSLLDLAANADASVAARASAEHGLQRIAAAIARNVTDDAGARAHNELAAADIARFLDRGHAERQRSQPADLAPVYDDSY